MSYLQRITYPLWLLILFIFYQVSITLFTHAHDVNGKVITHSHPAKKDHTHSQSEQILIEHLSVFHSPEIDSPFHFQVSFAFITSVVASFQNCVAVRSLYSVPSLRAPPVVHFL